MLSVKRIKRRFGGDICRDCINRTYRARLDPEDCVYGYLYTCPSCGEVRNIVVGLTPAGRLKLLFRF